VQLNVRVKKFAARFLNTTVSVASKIEQEINDNPTKLTLLTSCDF
jgi:hypothetical protein